LRRKFDAHEAIQLARFAHRPEWQGKTLAALAESEHRDPIEIAMEIERHGGASVINFGMQEDDVRFVMNLPWVATASDGRTMIVTGDQPHPRNFGTFPRKVGRYAIEDQLVPLEQAIRSCTSLPAEILGLADRGRLRVGMLADVIAFGPKTFRDHATYEHPFRYSTGIEHVFVNGQPAIYRGTPTGALAGRALRHPEAKPDLKQGAASD
jgi:N-acyl-D-aspartate/D-glutamate deacylase